MTRVWDVIAALTVVAVVVVPTYAIGHYQGSKVARTFAHRPLGTMSSVPVVKVVASQRWFARQCDPEVGTCEVTPRDYLLEPFDPLWLVSDGAQFCLRPAVAVGGGVE